MSSTQHRSETRLPQQNTQQSSEQTPATAPVETRRDSSHHVVRYVAAAIRLSLGWVFLWAFLDKAFGLGHETAGKDAWFSGGSPTNGFLAFGTSGPFKGMYQDIAGQGWADWLFMLGLLGIGVALMAGVAMRLAAAAGAVLLVLMWTAVLPPSSNLFMDDHLVYAMTLVLLAALGAGHTLGLGKVWERLPLVSQHRWLQ